MDSSENYASEIRACQGPPEIFEFEIPLEKLEIFKSGEICSLW